MDPGDPTSWRFLDEDVASGRWDRLEVVHARLLDAICAMVPSRTDLQDRIRARCADVRAWQIQATLVDVMERFQAPIYDQRTAQWRRRLPMLVSEFLALFVPHVQRCLHERAAYFDPARPMRSGR